MLDCAHVHCTKPLIGQNILFWELSKESLVHQSCRWFLDQQVVLDKNCIHHNFAFFLKDSLVWWSLALHGCFGDFFRGKETPCVPYHKICPLVTFGESTEVIQLRWDLMFENWTLFALIVLELLSIVKQFQKTQYITNIRRISWYFAPFDLS